tara:strand:- start:220 stop:420 length:201 start_codon:yes stop_codon:yes gene_type:complete
MTKRITFTEGEYSVLSAIIADRLNTLKKNLAKHNTQLDKYEQDITNYTTYDLHRKLSSPEVILDTN